MDWIGTGILGLLVVIARAHRGFGASFSLLKMGRPSLVFNDGSGRS